MMYEPFRKKICNGILDIQAWNLKRPGILAVNYTMICQHKISLSEAMAPELT